MLIHQSDFAAWSRCAAAYGYKLAGIPDKTNSGTAYGSVIHHALEVFERARATGTPVRDATQQAMETFVHFWHPSNIEAICDPVPPDGWLPKQGFNELREKGIDTIKAYALLVKDGWDDHELLATEFSFVVPIDGTWDEDLDEPHLLGGTIDRLAVRWYRRFETVCVDDYKSGKEYRYLRQNLQGTAYCYATTKPEFWVGNGGEDGFGETRGRELYERFLDKGRRFTWINLRTVKAQDGGWRGPDDYRRLAVATEQLVAARRAEIFPLSISGENCTFCSYRDICAGTGVPKDTHGAPLAA